MEDSKQLAEFRSDKTLFELPTDIVDTLCDNLSIKDQFRFARVCKSAHSSVYERANPIALKDTPWLIGLTDSPSSLFETTYNDQATLYKIGTRPFKYSEPNILGYSKGWFYVHYSHNDFIQLVNLFINVQIDLPPLSTMVVPKSKCGYLFAQAFALSLCKSMRPLMIAIVDQYGDLALCKTSGGSTWKAHEHHRRRDEGYYVNVTFYREKLYAMREKEFRKFDIFKVGCEDLRLFPLRVIEYKSVTNRSLSIDSIQQAYLVEDSKGDNMFIVMEYQYTLGNVFIFQVFKVLHDGDEFVRMNDLGDRIILLDDSNSEIIDVKDCSPSDIFKGNQICFKGGSYHDVRIYSFKNQLIIWKYPNKGEPLYRRRIFPGFKGLQYRWIFPRFITTTKCHCESH